MSEKTLRQQLRQNTVALISLVVAVSSLGYNTWRNEQTEANRNVRTAGIQLLLKVGELDRVVFDSHYGRDPIRGNPRQGWAYALTIRDLGTLTPEPARSASASLFDTWSRDFDGLGSDDEAAQRISEAIDRARNDMLVALAALD